jgi:hypothetical protein
MGRSLFIINLWPTMDLFQVYAQWVWGQTTIPAVVEFTNNFFQLFEDCETPNQANIVGIEAHEPMIVDLCIEKITWLLRTEALEGIVEWAVIGLYILQNEKMVEPRLWGLRYLVIVFSSFLERFWIHRLMSKQCTPLMMYWTQIIPREISIKKK